MRRARPEHRAPRLPPADRPADPKVLVCPRQPATRARVPEAAEEGREVLDEAPLRGDRDARAVRAAQLAEQIEGLGGGVAARGGMTIRLVIKVK